VDFRVDVFLNLGRRNRATAIGEPNRSVQAVTAVGLGQLDGGLV
jgi:hypothetical protein